MAKNAPYIAIFLCLFLGVFSCKEIIQEKSYNADAFQTQLSQVIESNAQSSKLPISSVWKQQLTSGHYVPLITEDEGIIHVLQVDSLLEQAKNHGFHNYFQPYLDSIRQLGITDDSIFQSLIKTENYQDIAKLEYFSRLAVIDYAENIQFGLLQVDSVFNGQKVHVVTHQADENWYSHQLTSNPLLNQSNFIVENPYYHALQQSYEQLLPFDKQDWTSLPKPKKDKLALGDEYVGSNQLRRQLNLDTLVQSSTIIDQELMNQVKQIQKVHGLPTDGVIDQATLAVLNKSPHDLLRQMEVSLERFRWKNNAYFDNLLLINIPDYRLFVYNQGKPIKSHKVCVGKSNIQYQTPEFIDTLSTIVVNPRWEVPRSIIISEILPYAQMDGSYFEYLQYDVYLGDKKISPYEVDFNQYNSKNFPFRVVQKKGDINALGFIKFLFPNRYNIYLHDTPSYGYFNNNYRAVSHGCVRLDKPFELGDYLMENNKQYVSAKSKSDTQSFQSIKKPQVYITYFTNWVDEDGRLQFRDDVYGRDRLIRQALDKQLGLH